MRTVRTLIDVHCDVCKGELDETTNAEEALSIALVYEGRAKRLDVCPLHKDPSWTQISTYWNDDLDATVPTAPRKPTGRGPTKEQRPAPTDDCPLCHSGYGVALTAHSLMMHLTKKHGDLPLAERQRLAGFPVTNRNVTPEAKARNAARTKSFPCVMECGKRFASLQALTAHLGSAKEHGDMGRDERLALVRAAKESGLQ